MYKSCSSVNLPIVAAILEIEKELGGSIVWNFDNDQQKTFLEITFPNLKEVASKIPEIETRSTIEEAGKIKNIKVISVFDLLVNWYEEGIKVDIVKMEDNIEKKYDGVSIKGDNVQIYRHLKHPNPVVELKTKSGDTVCMTMYDDEVTGVDLETIVAEITEDYPHSCYSEFRGLHFPMVDFKEKPDISFLVGMNTTDSQGWPTFITKAEQETKLKVNQKGAHIRSEVRMHSTTIGCSGVGRTLPPHIINRPFLIWFKRNGIELPMAICYISTDDWKDPKTLDM